MFPDKQFYVFIIWLRKNCICLTLGSFLCLFGGCIAHLLLLITFICTFAPYLNFEFHIRGVCEFAFYMCELLSTLQSVNLTLPYKCFREQLEWSKLMSICIMNKHTCLERMQTLTDYEIPHDTDIYCFMGGGKIILNMTQTDMFLIVCP